MDNWAIWALVALVAFLLEIFTAGFAIFCVTIGALAASVFVYFTGAAFAWQLLIFSLFTALSLLFIRPVVVRLFERKSDIGREARTNLDALIGRRAKVSQRFTNGEGRVVLDGDDWRAELMDGEDIEIGERVEVVRVESVILIVKRV